MDEKYSCFRREGDLFFLYFIRQLFKMSKSKGKIEEKVEDVKSSSNLMYLLSVFILIIVIAGMVFGLYSMYNQKIYNDKKEYCLKIQNSDQLKYNCTCVPDMDEEINMSDEIDTKTQRMCKCSCDTGKDEPYIVEIRKSKN